MSKIIGVDTSNIDNISGLGAGGGGITPVPSNTTSGIVICPPVAETKGPFSAAELADYANPAHMFQVDDATDVVKMVYGPSAIGYINDSGVVHTTGYQNFSYLGLSSSDWPDVQSNGGFKESLTGVSKFCAHSQGFFAVKTNGELWWAGSLNSMMNAAGTNGSTTSALNQWLQIGSDTDWVDIKGYTNYPWMAMGVKGAAGSRYLYSCGYNQNYGTGLGTNSSVTRSFTRVKSAADTDLAESIADFSISHASGLAVTDGGKLFSWGENGRGQLGTGNTTDKPYATQVGTDTDWSKCWVNPYAGFAMKTDGTMYMSTNQANWRIEPSTNSTFTQIGSDTDYEDLRVYDQISNNMAYTVLAKKNGSWYVSQGTYLQPGAWPGNTSSGKSSTTQGSWVALGTYMDKNAPTGTIDDILPFHSAVASTTPCMAFALS